MALTPHIATDFDRELIHHIQNGEGFVDETYYNIGDTPTIGYGFALFEKTNGNRNTNITDAMQNACVIINTNDWLLFDQVK